MTVRVPKPKSAARILRETLKSLGLEVRQEQALDVVAKLYGYNSYHAMRKAELSKDKNSLSGTGSESVLKAGPEPRSYELASKELREGCLIKIDDVVVSISGSEEQVVVDLLAAHQRDAKPIESVSASQREARKNRTAPDPQLPFYGCQLPRAVTALAVQRESNKWERMSAEHSCDGYLQWLESGMPNNDYDVSETAIICSHSPYSISGEDLLNARLEKDGFFTLKTGLAFYLIDQNGFAWKPTHRV